MDNILLMANIIGGLDIYIRENCDEDIVYDLWFACGMPDGETEEELMDDVVDNFEDWLRCAYRCIQLQKNRENEE